MRLRGNYGTVKCYERVYGVNRGRSNGIMRLMRGKRVRKDKVQLWIEWWLRYEAAMRCLGGGR